MALLTTLLIVLLVIAFVGALPTWRYSRAWGWGPAGFLGVFLVLLLILTMTGAAAS